MIDPTEFINKQKKEDYSSFKKMESSYMCQHENCIKYSEMVYRDDINNTIMWKCADGHENKIKAFLQ